MASPQQPEVVTVDQLRDSIDSGRAGDKVPFPDPAAAPLGTDAEAGGHPPTRKEIRMEVLAQAGSPTPTSWPRDTIGIVVYCGALGVICTLMILIVLFA